MVPSSGVKKLSLLDLPLTGRVLIEASAGTGKTYSLAFIYLRLLLGIGENSYPHSLDVSQILVVTFTKAATQELRSRIRNNIHELLIGLQKGQHEDPIYQQLITLVSDRNIAIQKLNQARQSMDEAAIYTIHSFCQRILTTHAFESGVLFEQTLVVDESQRYLQVVQDFWRHHFTLLDKSQAYLILQYWQDPASLLADITPYLNLELTDSIDSNFDLLATITDFYQRNLQRIDAIKKAWLDSEHQFANIITNSEISKQSYNSRNLPNWLTKVSQWACSPTRYFELPAELEKFSQSTLNAKTKDGKIAPKHDIFVMIDQLYITPIDLRSQILIPIAHIVQQAIYHEKLKQGEMGFEDLLLQLNRALKSQLGDKLAKSIAEKYRVVMIDEFQDTDPVQYQIFDRIYGDNKHRYDTGLLFIGDPKQAIYSFRGADIFTYLTAKLSVGYNHFTMDINWRSSQSMITAVNQLFSVHENPFLFTDIPFLQMNIATKNCHKALMNNNQRLAALNAYLLPDEISTVAQYQEQMSNCCAKQIVTWLSEPFLLSDNQHEQRRVAAADIAILVRTGREAELIQHKLALCGVKSVYLSNHNSVFSSTEAKDVLCLLKAVLMPENETVLRLALMTSLLGITMTQLEDITSDPDNWESIVEEFKQYQAIWQYYGVHVMFRRMMKKRYLAENILVHQDGERILTNLMHLSELLQEAANELDSAHALIRWLTKQIVNPDLNLENHEQRLESDENLVKIITIHKSKGLEFPLVWLPFIAQYRTADSHFYHDEKNGFQQTYAWKLTDEIKKQIEKERLAEDLRLLYVAMTRSIYHCSIGLASLKKSDSAISYLLNNNLKSIAQLANLVNVTLPISLESYVPSIAKKPYLSANIFQRKLANSWRVTSYTELQKHEQITAVDAEIINKYDEYQTNDQDNEINELKYDIHNFPKGTRVGTLLHKVMEKLTPYNITELSDELVNKLNLPLNWRPVLIDWITQLLTSKLNQKGLLLSQVLQGKCINELQFYLPIHQAVSSDQLDNLCKEYDALSKQCPKLDFETVQGMLKGFIDLVFEWQGKYYIVDYKSNWLGDSFDSYNQESLHKAMCEHRYELQYQLYSLALHRFLKSRLSDYDYQTHFGGVYYLFLRGMPDNGIFYYLPNRQFIEKLDQLFSG